MAVNDTAPTETPATETEKPTVDLTPPAQADGGDGPGWAEKKEARFQHWTQRKEEERQKLAQERDDERSQREKAQAEKERYAVELAEMRGRMAAMEEVKRQHAETSKVADADRELDELEERIRVQYAAEDWKGARALERKQQSLIARREAAEYARTNQASQPDPNYMIITSEFPWVQTNEQARRIADGWANILTAQKQLERPNLEVLREACKKAAESVGLTRPSLPAVTQAQRQLYGGTPPSRDMPSNGGGRYEPTDAEMTMAKRAANAAGLTGAEAEEFMRSFMSKRAVANPDRVR